MGERKHPIDVWLSQAIAKHGSTQGMREATNTATNKWDAEMNRLYRLLMRQMKPKQKAALLTSQKLWLKHRDAELAAIHTLYDDRDGTMWPLIADSNYLDIVRARALQLQSYEGAFETH